MSIIHTTNLCKQYGSNWVVTNLNIEINQGEVFTLLGPNGAGKTTTINLLTTLLKPSTGTATVNGFDIITDTKSVRKSISLLPQGSALDPFLSVYNNLCFYAKLVKLNAILWKRKAEEIFDRLDLTERKNYPVMTLSGGQLRRVQIARILLSETPVLFLDEPTLGIDIDGKVKVWDLIKQYRQNNNWTIILSTNDITEAEELSDRIAFLHHGSVVKLGSPRELKEQIPEKSIVVRYVSPIVGESTLREYPVIIVDDYTIQILLDKQTRDLRPILENACHIGCIQEVSVHEPSITDIFRSIGKERS